MDINSANLAILTGDIEKYRRRKIMDDLDDNIVYIDPLGYKSKIKVANNNIIVGRRGSGKTTIMLAAYKDRIDCTIIKFDCQHIRNYDENKIIIKLVSKVLSEVSNGAQIRKNELSSKVKEIKKGFWEKPKAELHLKEEQEEQEELKEVDNICELIADMYNLLVVDVYDLPEEITYKRATIQIDKHTKSKESKSSIRKQSGLGGSLGVNASYHNIGLKINAMNNILKESVQSQNDKGEQNTKSELSYEEVIKKSKSQILDELIEPIAELLSMYRKIVKNEVSLYLDDFYQINMDKHVRIIQYLHNIYKQSKNSAFCFKLCTLPNRIKINKENDIILSIKDDFSEILLDKDLINIEGLKKYLIQILCALRKDLEIQPQDIENLFSNEESILYLVIASGGTPRDFLLMFRDMVDIVKAENSNRRIGKADIYSVVRAMREDKDENIEYDVNITPEMIQDALIKINNDIIVGKNTNVFLFPNSKKDEYELLLRNLVNARYLHLIKEKVSSENRKKEYFSAYLIDMSFYISGKQIKRGFKFRPFWEKDNESRYNEIASAPIFSFD